MTPKTALMVAALFGHPLVVVELCRRGANPRLQNEVSVMWFHATRSCVYRVADVVPCHEIVCVVPCHEIVCVPCRCRGAVSRRRLRGALVFPAGGMVSAALRREMQRAVLCRDHQPPCDEWLSSGHRGCHRRVASAHCVSHGESACGSLPSRQRGQRCSARQGELLLLLSHLCCCLLLHVRPCVHVRAPAVTTTGL